MAAITFEGTTGGGSAKSQTATLTLPGAVKAGDLLVAYLSYYQPLSVTTVPTGWTLLTSATFNPQITVAAYTRTATASDAGATYSWITSSGGIGGASIQVNAVVWRNAKVDVYAGNFSGGTVVCSSVTPNTTTDVNTLYAAQWAVAPSSWIDPPGYTGVAENSTGLASRFAYKQLASSAATGNQTFQPNQAGDGVGITIALKATPAAPTITAPLASSTVTPGAQTVTWTDDEPAGYTQTGYALRRSADGGSTWHWYNGTDWSSTIETFVVSASTTVSTPSWTDQVALWQVQVATENSNGAGAYSAVVSFFVHATPVITITAPTNNGTVSGGGPTLTITWTYSQAESLPETQYRVIVQNAAGSTTYYDSGWDLGTALTLSINAQTYGIPTDTTGHALKVIVEAQDFDGVTLLGQATNAFDIQWGVVSLAITAPTANQVIASSTVAVAWTASSTRGVSMNSYEVSLTITQTNTLVYDSLTTTPWATGFTPPYVLTDFSQYTATVTVANTNGITGTASVVFSTAQSDPATAYTALASVGRIYDVGINGVGLILGPGSVDGEQSPEWMFSTIGKPLEPMRFATGETPFAQQIDHYHFTSMTDWRGGAGQKFLERDASVPNGYLDSDGVDPFTPYQLTLLHDTARDVTTNQNPCCGAPAGGNVYVQTGAAQLKFETTPGGSLTTINLTGPTSVVDMTTDGQQWYATDITAGIYRGTTTNPGATAWSAPGGASQLPAGAKASVISFAGQRLCVGYATSGSTPHVWSTLTDAGTEEVTNGRLVLPSGWTVTKTTSGNGYLFFGAFSGSKGSLYRYQLGTSATPSVCWDLPEGEIPIDVRWYQQQLLIRTAIQLPSGGRQMRIWRAPVDTNGNPDPQVVQTFGKTTDTVDNAAGAWGALGDKVFFSWYNMDGAGNSGIGCLDLAMGGYAKWHHGVGLGTIRAIFNYNGRVAFVQDATGLIMEQSTYRAQGWAKTSLSDVDAVVGKVWDHLYIHAAAVAAGESITLDYTLDDGTTFTTLTAMNMTTAGQRDVSTLLSQKSTTIGLRVWLNGPGSTTPTVHRLTWEVHQFGIADTMVQVPVDCGDYITDMKASPIQADSGPGKGMARLRWLQSLLYTRILFQDLDYQDTKAATVYELVQIQTSQRSKYDARIGKQANYTVATVTLRRLSR